MSTFLPGSWDRKAATSHLTGLPREGASWEMCSNGSTGAWQRRPETRLLFPDLALIWKGEEGEIGEVGGEKEEITDK